MTRYIRVPIGWARPSVEDFRAEVEERETHDPECCSRKAGMLDACDCWKAR